MSFVLLFGKVVLIMDPTSQLGFPYCFFLSVFSNFAFYLLMLLLFTLLLCHFFLLSLLFCSYFYFILHFYDSLCGKEGAPLHAFLLFFLQHFFQPSHVVIFCPLLGFLPPFFFYLLF